MLIEYGFATVHDGDKKYQISPTLSNISKIGTPKEIVETFEILALKHVHYIRSFGVAVSVLEACGLPEEITGCLVFSDHSNKLLICPGRMPVRDVFIFAEHCLAHGVCGVVPRDDADADKIGEPLEEFDAHQYIITAVEHLGVSLTEAGNMTMTQFVKLVKARSKNNKAVERKKEEANPNEKITSEEQIPDLMAWYHERAEAAKKKAQEKLSETGNKHADQVNAAASISKIDAIKQAAKDSTPPGPRGNI